MAAAPNIGTDLTGTNNYIRALPKCPGGGAYSAAAAIGTTPQCNLSGTGSGNADTNYNTGGKFYHGL